MASSIGSFPFLVELNADSSLLLHSKISRPLRFPLFAYHARKYSAEPSSSVNFNGSALEHRGNRGLLWRTKHLRAIGKSVGSSEDNDGPEDVLQTTIEKSKKVLAMQRDLLHQVLFLSLLYNVLLLLRIISQNIYLMMM